MITSYFNNQTTQQLFQRNNLENFEQLWSLQADWFEPPNYRRNGWSGVVKYALNDHEGQVFSVFIKRQENHNYKTLLHPFKGIPTFRREFYNIQRLTKNHIPTLELLYYGERSVKGNIQSILITRSLENYQSFEAFFNPPEAVDRTLTKQIMQLAGQHTRHLHDAHFRHGSLYPKHFFVKADKQGIDVRFIDLEKLKWFPFAYLVRLNDLSRIIRRRYPINKAAIKILLQSYLTTGSNLQNSRLSRQLDKLLQEH